MDDRKQTNKLGQSPFSRLVVSGARGESHSRRHGSTTTEPDRIGEFAAVIGGMAEESASWGSRK